MVVIMWTCTVLCCAVQCIGGAVRCYIYAAVRFFPVLCDKVLCGELQCGAVRCSVVRCSVVLCSAVRYRCCGGVVTVVADTQPLSTAEHKHNSSAMSAAPRVTRMKKRMHAY